MSKKYIRQNYLLKIKNVMKEVERDGEKADHFRAIIIAGDKQESSATSYIHASHEDVQNLLLQELLSNDSFAYSVACAMEKYCKIKEKKEDEKNNS